jgi:hypothetical protein
MKAQEFGAVIDSLADECFDRVYDDDSRRDFFVEGSAARPENKSDLAAISTALAKGGSRSPCTSFHVASWTR